MKNKDKIKNITIFFVVIILIGLFIYFNVSQTIFGTTNIPSSSGSSGLGGVVR